MTLSYISYKIKSPLSCGHIKPSTNQQLTQNSDNLASIKSKLRSHLYLLLFICPFICLSNSSQCQTSGGY